MRRIRRSNTVCRRIGHVCRRPDVSPARVRVAATVRSLDNGIAVCLAGEHPLSRLVLVTPYVR
jgi:hypothetical protein